MSQCSPALLRCVASAREVHLATTGVSECLVPGLWGVMSGQCNEQTAASYLPSSLLRPRGQKEGWRTAVPGARLRATLCSSAPWKRYPGTPVAHALPKPARARPLWLQCLPPWGDHPPPRCGTWCGWRCWCSWPCCWWCADQICMPKEGTCSWGPPTPAMVLWLANDERQLWASVFSGLALKCP